jgi:hypothetical protein
MEWRDAEGDIYGGECHRPVRRSPRNGISAEVIEYIGFNTEKVVAESFIKGLFRYRTSISNTQSMGHHYPKYKDMLCLFKLYSIEALITSPMH